MNAISRIVTRCLAAAVVWSCLASAVLLAAEAGQYVGPTDVVASADGQSLFVVAADRGQVLVVDATGGKITKKIDCPAKPTGLAVAADGATLYVTCGGANGSVCIVDVDSGQVSSTIPVGHTPCAPLLLPGGKRLFVCNRFDNNVSVIDLQTNKQTASVKAIREPVAAAATPKGDLVFVTNLLPVDRSDSDNVAAEVTVIDTASLKTTAIRLPNGSSSVREVCVSTDGVYAFVVHILSRYQMPTTQLERGWMNTNAMSVIDVAKKRLLNTVLLDSIDLGSAMPWAVSTTADGKSLIVSHASTHELSIIDAKGLIAKLKGMPSSIEEAKTGGRYDAQGNYSSATAADVPNDLSYLVGLRRRVSLRQRQLCKDKAPMINGPRGVDVIGTKIYTAVYFSDLIAVVDLEDQSYCPVKVIPLGPEPDLTVQRRGEMFFHDATLCFQRWQSCASCHPDARVDALNWDLLNDGLGTPKNSKSMLYVHRTPPAMSQGVRESAEKAVRAGITHIQFAVRPEEDAVAIDEYLKSLQPVPSPYLVNGKLSTAAERGGVLFFSQRLGCADCHPRPLYTDQKQHDVGSKGRYDRAGEFDTPTLIECWRTAPYMHDGQYTTIQRALKEGKHGHMAGDVEGLTDQEINDLVEFVLSL